MSEGQTTERNKRNCAIRTEWFKMKKTGTAVGRFWIKNEEDGNCWSFGAEGLLVARQELSVECRRNR